MEEERAPSSCSFLNTAEKVKLRIRRDSVAGLFASCMKSDLRRQERDLTRQSLSNLDSQVCLSPLLSHDSALVKAKQPVLSNHISFMSEYNLVCVASAPSGWSPVKPWH